MMIGGPFDVFNKFAPKQQNSAPSWAPSQRFGASIPDFSKTKHGINEELAAGLEMLEQAKSQPALPSVFASLPVWVLPAGAAVLGIGLIYFLKKRR